MEGKPVLVGVGTDGSPVSISDQNSMGVNSSVIICGYSGHGVLHTVLNWHVKMLCAVLCLVMLMKC